MPFPDLSSCECQEVSYKMMQVLHAWVCSAALRSLGDRGHPAEQLLGDAQRL